MTLGKDLYKMLKSERHGSKLNKKTVTLKTVNRFKRFETHTSGWLWCDFPFYFTRSATVIPAIIPRMARFHDNGRFVFESNESASESCGSRGELREATECKISLVFEPLEYLGATHL